MKMGAINILYVFHHPIFTSWKHLVPFEAELTVKVSASDTKRYCAKLALCPNEVEKSCCLEMFVYRPVKNKASSYYARGADCCSSG